MKKHKWNQKKALSSFALIVLGLGLLFVGFQNRPAPAEYEEIVFIRHIEKSGFDYVLTIDQASNLLSTDEVDVSTREVSGVESMRVASGVKVFLLGEGGAVGIRDLLKKFESDSTYVSRVFTVGVTDGEIVSITEEDL